MKNISIEERAISLAQYIIDSKDTVRGAAKRFVISKSTVHTEVGELQVLDIPKMITLSDSLSYYMKIKVKLAIKL